MITQRSTFYFLLCQQHWTQQREANLSISLEEQIVLGRLASFLLLPSSKTLSFLLSLGTSNTTYLQIIFWFIPSLGASYMYIYSKLLGQFLFFDQFLLGLIFIVAFKFIFLALYIGMANLICLLPYLAKYTCGSMVDPKGVIGPRQVGF